ncbi:hypothetical protein GA0115240_13801, partial [Streptomyces sp. DvalAA-14]
MSTPGAPIGELAALGPFFALEAHGPYEPH